MASSGGVTVTQAAGSQDGAGSSRGETALPGAQPFAPKADPVVATGEKAQSRWQTPRFIDGEFTPLSVSAAGNRAAILAGEGTLFTGFTKLVLFESTDGGENWGRSGDFPGYSNGAVQIDAQGNCALVGYVPAADGKKIGLTSPVTRSEILLRKNGGAFEKPQAVFKAPADSPIYSAPGLCMGKGSLWSFGVHRENSRSTTQVMAANAEGLSAPKPIAREWPTYVVEASTGWAADARTAGFVIYSKDHPGLRSYATKDAGQTWQETPIAFQPDLGSEGTLQSASPAAIAINGDKLLLVVMAIIKGNGAENDMKNITFQHFALISPDLGKTWGAPIEVSTRAANPIGDCSAVLLDHCMMICRTKAASIEELMQQVGTDSSIYADADVHVSEDNGVTWYKHHAFEAIGRKAGAISSAGSGETIHVAVLRADGAGKNCMVIRSFAPGEWKAPSTPAPEWFKEAKLAPPTRQDF